MQVDPAVVDEGELIALEAQAEHPERHPLRFAWSFGDGTELAFDSQARSTFTVYADDGTYEILVTAEDPAGRADTARTQVTVRNVAPEVERIDRVGAAIESTELTFRARVHDPGDDTLSYAWDFGDGTTLGPSRDLETADHIYRTPGTYTIRLTVDDGDGGSTTHTEELVVGEGFRFSATGALPAAGNERGDSPFLLGLPLILDGEVFRFAGDLGAAVRGEPAADTGARCLVAFGNRVPTIQTAIDPGVTVGFTGFFPDGIREGTYPIAAERNQIPFPVHNAFELEWDSPNTFFASASVTHALESGLEGIQFHGAGGSVTVHLFEEGRVELSFSAGLEEAQGPLDIIDGPGGATLPPPATASIRGTFQHEIQRSLAGGDGSMNPLTGGTYGDWYLCAPRDPLLVEEVVPQPDAAGEANDVPLIPYTDPEITIRFSEAIDLDSAVENVVLEWRRADGTFQDVPILVIGDSERTLRLSPLDDLMDGVVYRARIVGGLGGLQGRDGEVLGQDEEWLFETILDLSEDRHGVTIATTQVARDAPLVAEKPTETRIYLNWRAKPHVHPQWQTLYATFDVIVYGAETGTRRVRVKRPDLYTERELKHALDSVNFYGWRPSTAGSHDLTAHATQVGQGHTPRTFKGSLTAAGYGAARDLVFDYWFIGIGPWEQGVPLNARSLGHRIARSGATFTTQTFPVPEVIARYRGDMTIIEPDQALFELDGHEYLVWSLLTRRDEPVAEAFAEGIGATDADVVIAFMPPGVLSISGYQYKALGTDPRIVSIQLDPDQPLADAYFGSTIAHEIGHGFGLTHNTNCADVIACSEQSRSDPIEGTRIASSGNGGWNKSRWSGNAQGQRTPGAVISLMHPDNLPDDGVFITNDDYLELQDRMRARTSGGTSSQSAPTHAPAVIPGPQHVQEIGSAGLFVTGWIDSVNGRAVIDSIRPGGDPGTAPHPPEDSEYVLESHTPTGATMGRGGVTLHADGFGHAPEALVGVRPFSGFVASNQATAAVSLLHDGRVIAERHATASIPTVAFSDHEYDLAATNEVRWEASDADGDPLTFDLEYAPDGRDWRPLALGLRESRHTLHLDGLIPGEQPMLRVIASDGFHVSSATIPVELPPLSPLLGTLPADGAQVELATRIEVWASRPVTADAYELTLAAEGEAAPAHVEGEVIELAGGLGLRFTPLEPLQPETTYRATLEPSGDGATLERVAWTFRTAPPPPAPAIQERNLTGAAMRPATTEGAEHASALPSTCAGIPGETLAVLVPEGAQAIEAVEDDGGCRISLQVGQVPEVVRAFVERTIITNRFFLTSNRSEDTLVRISFQSRDLTGEVTIESGPPTRLTWLLQEP